MALTNTQLVYIIIVVGILYLLYNNSNFFIITTNIYFFQFLFYLDNTNLRNNYFFSISKLI